MSNYHLYSNPEINKQSLVIKDNVVKALTDNNYVFGYHYNDLYFLKTGNTVRRLKGYVYHKDADTKNVDDYKLSADRFMKVREIVESCSTNKFKCEFNLLRIDAASNLYNASITYIVKITNL